MACKLVNAQDVTATAEAFAPVDARVGAGHVSWQLDVVSRETGATDTGWVAIGYLTTAEDAYASIDNFTDAPAASDLIGRMDAE